jgi:hypothetical protein
LNRNHQAAISADIPFGSRTRLRLEQTAAYATYFTLMGLPGAPQATNIIVPGQDLLLPSAEFGVSTESGWERHSAVVLSRQTGRGNSLEGRYATVRTDFARQNDIAQQESTWREAGLTYRHALRQQMAIRVGYGYETGGARGGEPLVFHDLDAGLEYQRSLTRSRNTYVSFSTGSAVIASETTRDYRLLADAQLVHRAGRNWTSSIGYHRGIDFVGVLSQLVASDALNTTLNGFFTPRLEASVSAIYSKGHLGIGHGDSLTTYSGVSRLQYALSRRMAVDLQYLYYFYEFGEGTLRPIGVARQLARQSVRGGIAFWLPILR